MRTMRQLQKPFWKTPPGDCLPPGGPMRPKPGRNGLRPVGAAATNWSVF
ncbi:MAG: hypothetical protein LBU32_10145 [Clostridiales bacterium]|nr:hypothetical protein [Clostridiales bacterium]